MEGGGGRALGSCTLLYDTTLYLHVSKRLLSAILPASWTEALIEVQSLLLLLPRATVESLRAGRPSRYQNTGGAIR